LSSSPFPLPPSPTCPVVPVPLLPISTLQAVAHSGGWGCWWFSIGCHPPPCPFVPSVCCLSLPGPPCPCPMVTCCRLLAPMITPQAVARRAGVGAISSVPVIPFLSHPRPFSPPVCCLPFSVPLTLV
jgi:hypothetical protein